MLAPRCNPMPILIILIVTILACVLIGVDNAGIPRS